MMKKVTIRRIVWRLRCRKCGREATHYGKDLASLIGWNGWNLEGTEICPLCRTPEEKLPWMKCGGLRVGP